VATKQGKKKQRGGEIPKPVLYLRELRKYLREVVYELRKVVWPSRKETIGTTVVVLILVLVFGIYLGIVDSILSRVVRFLIE